MDTDTVVAAAKFRAYGLQPNMAPSFELSVSSAHLASRSALRISFLPSQDVDALVNSLLIRSSLPYDFSSCRLLWEEPKDRAAIRPSDPVFMFAGDPRCEGKLHEATLYAVLLDTSYKERVTLYVANFTVPAPPYAAARSIWEVVLQRARGALAPEPLDIALGVQGPGAFGDVKEPLPIWAGGAGGFVGNLNAGQHINVSIYSCSPASSRCQRSGNRCTFFHLHPSDFQRSLEALCTTTCRK